VVELTDYAFKMARLHASWIRPGLNRSPTSPAARSTSGSMRGMADGATQTAVPPDRTGPTLPLRRSNPLICGVNCGRQIRMLGNGNQINFLKEGEVGRYRYSHRMNFVKHKAI